MLFYWGTVLTIGAVLGPILVGIYEFYYLLIPGAAALYGAIKTPNIFKGYTVHKGYTYQLIL